MKRCFGCMESYDDSMQKCPHCGYEEAAMSQESFQLRPGLTLKGHYLLGKVLGYGGFGTTYLAWDETMRRTVAIKEYLPTVFATRGTERTMVTVYAGAKAEQFEKGRKQFLEEARKLARFTGHDSIVGVYDFFEENGTAYIVMEYLDGETLTEYLRRERRMTFEAALRVMVPVLKALQEVHKEGIIHRDIAPDNIRITKDGKVKLLDFGAAREASINHSHSLSVIYKPGYAPEEQYQSRGEQGPWTDVYALAATFYRMITGTKPAPALERLVSDTLVPPSELGVRMSKNQETALLNALNVRKENRTQSAEAFLRELESAEDVVRVVADSGTEKNKKKKSGGGGKAILLVLLGLILLGGGAFFTCKALGVFGEKKQEIGTNEARVPSFVNSTWQEAQTLAKEANLVIEVSGVEYSAEIQKDLVLKQSVKSGSVVEAGTKIELVISGGIKQISMLEVTGLSVEAATELLTGRGFKVETKEEFSAFAVGNVVESNLSTGELYADGTTVILTVSKGLDESKVEETEFVVGNYVGKSVDTLEAEFATHGILMEVTSVFSSTVKKGCIISQDVKAGTTCKPGATVCFTVSKGVEMVLVPSCIYRDEAEAIAELESLGFVVSVTEDYSDSVQAGKVIRQAPGELEELEKGTMVELVVSLGQQPVTPVPATETPTKAPATSAPTKAPATSAPTKTPVPATPTPVAYVNFHKAKVGTYVYYGNYEQDGNIGNGAEKIEWLVLDADKENNRLLLISRYCLDSVQYNTTSDYMFWSKSSIRTWLNNTFYAGAFSYEEQGHILSTNVKNENNAKLGTYAGEDTTDKIFLLSESEVTKYFPKQADAIAKATKYAQNQGVIAETAKATKGNCEWWLRTPGKTNDTAATVSLTGSVSFGGSAVQLVRYGVRPVMWVEIKK